MRSTCNITGSFNTAIGFDALVSNTIGFQNSATGYQALYFNTGGFNTANGVFALFNNTTGIDNTAYGVNALFHSTSGSGNTAVGAGAGKLLRRPVTLSPSVRGRGRGASCFIGNVYSKISLLLGTIPTMSLSLRR